MSTLTKILIVVFVVLAIFSATVFMQHVVRTADLTRWGQGEKRRADLNRSLLELSRNQLKLLQTSSENARRADARSIETLQDKIVELTGNLSQQGMQLGQEKNITANLTASLAIQAEDQKALLARNELLASQVVELEKTIAKQSDQLASLEQDKKKRELDLQLAEEQIKFLHEQVADRERRITELEAAPVAGVAPAVAPGAKPVLINATVQAVNVDGHLAQLNVGSAAGVTRGMRFTIYRGGDFIANLDVEDVGASVATGVLTNLQKTPQQGDKATNDLSR